MYCLDLHGTKVIQHFMTPLSIESKDLVASRVQFLLFLSLTSIFSYFDLVCNRCSWNILVQETLPTPDSKLPVYGRYQTFIKWIDSILSQKSKAIKVDGYLLSPYTINTDAPQCSVVSPVLFIRFNNYLLSSTSISIILSLMTLKLFRVLLVTIQFTDKHYLSKKCPSLDYHR